MRTRSAQWRTLAANGQFIMESKARIGGVDYTDISAPKIDRSLMDTPMSVGNCISASLSLSIKTDTVIPAGASIVIQGRLTDGETYSEWKEFGTFFISRRDTSYVGLLTVECFDSMLKANQSYLTGNESASEEESWPKPMQTVVEAIAARLGVGIDPRTVIKTGSEYKVSYPSGRTMADVLGFIGACHGGNWIITEDNLLRLVPLVSAVNGGSSGESVNVPAVCGDLSTGKNTTVTGVQMTDDAGNTRKAGNANGAVITVESCPYATQGICDDLFTDFGGLQYAPYTATQAIYDPATELGDLVVIGNKVSSVLYHAAMTLDLNFRSDISAPNSEKLETEYPFLPETKKTDILLNKAKEHAAMLYERTDKHIYQELYGDEGIEKKFDSKVEQTAKGIKQTVAASQGIFDQSYYKEVLNPVPGNLSRYYERKGNRYVKTADTAVDSNKTYYTKEQYNIDYHGYGTPVSNNLDAADYSGDYYLDHETGVLYTSNGSTWTIVASLDLIESIMSSQMIQTANQVSTVIRAAVSLYDTDAYFESIGAGSTEVNLCGDGQPITNGYYASDYAGEYYLDQQTGFLYRSNGSSWTNVATLQKVTEGLRSEYIRNEREFISAYYERLALYDETGYTVDVRVEGTPADNELDAAEWNGKNCLNVTDGKLYHSNGSSWSVTATLPQISGEDYSSQIQQTAKEIRQELSAAINKYDEGYYTQVPTSSLNSSNISTYYELAGTYYVKTADTAVVTGKNYYTRTPYDIAVWGCGVPANSDAAEYNGRYYLDQRNGRLYQSNGTAWSYANITLTLISEIMHSEMLRTARNVTSAFAASLRRYDTGSYEITLRGAGAPSDIGYAAANFNNKYYLDQSTGALYLSNGSTWSYVTTLNYISDDYTSSIEQSAHAIKATVAAAVNKYDTSSIQPDLYGYGTPNANSYSAQENEGLLYLDQNNGRIYLALDHDSYFSWDYITTLTLITDNLASRITQTANSISATVTDGNLISKINARPEQIDIASSRLKLSSDLFSLDGGVITSKHKTNDTVDGIVSIDTGRITCAEGVNNPKIVRLQEGEIIFYLGQADINHATGSVRSGALGTAAPNQPYLSINSNEKAIALAVDNQPKVWINNGANPYGYTNGVIVTDHTRFRAGAIVDGAALTVARGLHVYDEIQIYQTDYAGAGSIRYASGDNFVWINGNNFKVYHGNLYVQSGNATIEGNLSVSGTKNRIVNTEHHGKVALNAMESAGAVFSDMGSSVIGEDGAAEVRFDAVFRETITPSAGYQVFTTQTSEGSIGYVEKGQTGFIVHGTPGTTFDWIIYAKQKGYEETYLDQVNE